MKIPVTLVTGYLGAGKTTLLRRIIDTADRKIAVLVNEFGSVGIDGAILSGKNVNMIELKGGCVCCSLTGEFEAAVAEIRDKVKPELIVIETTGVAEPDAIVGDITERIDGVRLDAVVTVVDADSMIRFPFIGHTGRVQIEMADVIVLNKNDLVNETGVIVERLKAINSGASIIPASFCDVDMDLIVDVKSAKKRVEEHDHGHSVKMGSFAYESAKKISKKNLEEFLLALPKDIIRVKGFVATDEGSFLVNSVFGRLNFEDFGTKSNMLVFIGKNADSHREPVLVKLRECEVE